jgi:hypothetical protein
VSEGGKVEKPKPIVEHVKSHGVARRGLSLEEEPLASSSNTSGVGCVAGAGRKLIHPAG